MVEHEDPTALLDLWAGHDPVVVVDAVRSGGPAGTIHRLETGDGAPPMPERAVVRRTGRGGTHAFGLAAAVELGRALHRLPPRLVVVGVEADGFDVRRPADRSGRRGRPVAAARVLAVVLGEVSADVPR